MEDENVKHVAAELQLLFPGLLPARATYNELIHALSLRLDQMITEDFSALIQLLYRIDISETKLRNMINATSDQSASKQIAQLIIERQMQKAASRKLFIASNDIPVDDKW